MESIVNYTENKPSLEAEQLSRLINEISQIMKNHRGIGVRIDMQNITGNNVQIEAVDELKRLAGDKEIITLSRSSDDYPVQKEFFYNGVKFFVILNKEDQKNAK